MSFLIKGNMFLVLILPSLEPNLAGASCTRFTLVNVVNTTNDVASNIHVSTNKYFFLYITGVEINVIGLSHKQPYQGR